MKAVYEAVLHVLLLTNSIATGHGILVTLIGTKAPLTAPLNFRRLRAFSSPATTGPKVVFSYVRIQSPLDGTKRHRKYLSTFFERIRKAEKAVGMIVASGRVSPKCFLTASTTVLYS